MSIFHKLAVVGRISETQLQVREHSNKRVNENYITCVSISDFHMGLFVPYPAKHDILKQC